MKTNTWATVYEGTWTTFQLYWKAYGGFSALVRSPYLHFSILLSAACYPLWKEAEWVDLVISVTPSVLGFSLGGYAILLAFGDDKFRGAVCGRNPDGSESPFMRANAAFIHFITVSTMSLIYGIIAKSWKVCDSVCAALGFILFIYSVATALASALAILTVASWYDAHVDIAKRNGGA